jgi:hypothetical protein
LRRANTALEELIKKAAKYDDTKEASKKLETLLKELLAYQFEGVHAQNLGAKNSLLIFRLVSEIRDLNDAVVHLAETVKASSPKKD